MEEHDYSGCAEEDCTRCFDYRSGYEAGRLQGADEAMAAVQVGDDAAWQSSLFEMPSPSRGGVA